MATDFFERRERHLRAVTAVERAEEAVIIPSGNRIVFVVVTARATQRQAEHGRAGGRDHVIEFIEARADSLFLHQVVSEFGVRSSHDEAGGGNRLRVVRLEFVAGQLPAHERVERKVVIQAADDEVAKVMRGGPVRVALLSIAVGVAHHVEPMARPAFPVMRAGEELIDERRHGGPRVVGECLEE